MFAKKSAFASCQVKWGSTDQNCSIPTKVQPNEQKTDEDDIYTPEGVTKQKCVK